MSSFYLLLVLASSLALAQSDSPCYANSDKLPDHVSPIHYELFLVPNFETQTYSAELTIEVKIAGEFKKPDKLANFKRLFCIHSNDCAKSTPGQLEKPNNIVLHADKALNIERVEYELVGPKKNKSVPISSTCRDQRRQLMEIELAQPLAPGSTGLLKIKYSSTIRNDLRGFHVIRGDDEPRHDVYVTQFQGSDVRLAIPSFDEPRFRASVSLRVKANVIGHVMVASSPLESETEFKTGKKDDIGNDIGHTVWVFKKSPPIPLSLYAFSIGWMESRGTSTKSGVAVNTLIGPKSFSQTYGAVETAVKAIEWMESYTGIPYPGERFQFLVLTNHLRGVTPNWSLTTIYDALVAIGRDSDPRMEIVANYNIIRSVVHQWVSNMVSMESWQDVWVSEGLASYLTLQFMERTQELTGASVLLRLGSFDDSIRLDSTGTQRALSPERVDTAAEIEAAYSKLAINKAGAIMAMLSDRVGAKQFGQSIRSFLSDHQFASSSASEFLSYLNDDEASRAIVPWLTQPGVPLLSVKSVGRRAFSVYQEPYDQSAESIDESRPRSCDRLWTVPLSVKFTDRDSHWDSETVMVAASNKPTIMQAPEWFDLTKESHSIIVNAEESFANFYRVRYSDDIMRKFQEGFRFLPPRAQTNLLMDLIQLSRDGKVPANSLRDFVAAHEFANSPELQLALLKAASAISPANPNEVFTPGASPLMDVYAIQRFRSDDLSPYPIERLVYQETLTALVDADIEEVVDKGSRVLSIWGSRTFGYYMLPVYIATVKAGAKDEVERLFKELTKFVSYDKRFQIAQAFARSKDPQTLDRLLSWVQESVLRPADASYVVNLVANNEHGRGVIAKHSELMKKLDRAPKQLVPSGVRGKGNL